MKKHSLKEWTNETMDEITPTMFYQYYLPDLYNSKINKHTCFFCKKKSVQMNDRVITCNNSNCVWGSNNIIELYGKIHGLFPDDNIDLKKILIHLGDAFHLDYSKYLDKVDVITVERGFYLQFLLQYYLMVKQISVADFCKGHEIKNPKEFNKILKKPPSTKLKGVGEYTWLTTYTYLQHKYPKIFEDATLLLADWSKVIYRRRRQFEFDMIKIKGNKGDNE